MLVYAALQLQNSNKVQKSAVPWLSIDEPLWKPHAGFMGTKEGKENRFADIKGIAVTAMSSPMLPI